MKIKADRGGFSFIYLWCGILTLYPEILKHGQGQFNCVWLYPKLIIGVYIVYSDLAN